MSEKKKATRVREPVEIKQEPVGTPQEETRAEINNPAAAITKQEPAGTTQEENGTRPLMYVGPTITGFAIQNRVYSRIPDEAKERFKTSPWLRNLFIPVSEYPKANKSLRTRTGYIYEAYMKAGEVRNG